MLARIAILSLLAATLCSATLIHQLRLTGTVRSGSTSVLGLNGVMQSSPLTAGSPVEILIEMDFDLRPAVVINDFSPQTEFLYESTSLAPEWITRFRVTLLDFPTFGTPHLPTSNVWEVRRNPAPPGATEIAASTHTQEAAALTGGGFESTRINKSVRDEWSLPGTGAAFNQAFGGLIMGGISFFDANTIRAFPVTTVSSSPTLGFGVTETFFTGSGPGGGFTQNRGVFVIVDVQTAEGQVPEPGTWALMTLGLGAVWLRRRKASTRLLTLCLTLVALAPATPIYQLRLTGTVRSGSVDSLTFGPSESHSLTGARFTMDIDIDFDQRPAPVFLPFGPGTEIRFGSSTLAPEWIAGATVTFLDFPTFTANALPVNSIRQFRRLPRPAGATDVSPPAYNAELAQLAALNSIRIGLDVFDSLSVPGSGKPQRQASFDIELDGAPVFFDENSITPFPLTALAGAENAGLLFSFESFDTTNLSQGVLGF